MANIGGNDVSHHEPDPAMRRLGTLTGRCFTQGTVETDPVSKPVILEAEGTCEWWPAGFFLVYRVDGRTGEQEVKAIEVIGYDATEGMYVTHSLDNHGAVGTYKATLTDRTWTITGRSERFAGTFNDEGTALSGTWERSDDGSNWVSWMTVILQKIDWPNILASNFRTL